MTKGHGQVGITYFDCDLLALGLHPCICMPGIAKGGEKTIPLDWKFSLSTHHKYRSTNREAEDTEQEHKSKHALGLFGAEVAKPWKFF